MVVNHFSSKMAINPLFGRFQPPVRVTRDRFESGRGRGSRWRHAQAQAINDFVDQILAIDRKANVVVLGDINDFDFSVQRDRRASWPCAE